MFKAQNFSSSSELQQSTESGIYAEFDKNKLTSALLAVSAAISEPDIGWVQLFFSGNNKVIISSVSYNISIKYELEAQYTGTGTIKVSGRQFYDYIKQLPSPKVTVKAETSAQINVRSGRSSAKIQLIQDPSQSSVDIPEVGTHIVVKGNFIDQWISSFKDFVCVDDTRFYANGSLIWIEENQEKKKTVLRSIASDARCLANITLYEEIDVKNYDSSQVIVPRKALEELKRVSSQNPDKEFHLKWSQQLLYFAVECDEYKMLAKCIAGMYPPYETAIPQNINLVIQIDLKSIQESVKRVLLFADKNRVMTLNFENALLTMASITPGQKEGEEVIEINSSIASPLEVNYNGKLLTDILNVVNGSRVTFAWESASRPVKITGEEQRGIEVFYLLVPARF